MMGVVRVAWSVVVALVTLVRYLVAFPLLLVYIGAEARGDVELTDRLDRWIDRVVGAPQP
jgi:hypothetical protein